MFKVNTKVFLLLTLNKQLPAESDTHYQANATQKYRKTEPDSYIYVAVTGFETPTT